MSKTLTKKPSTTTTSKPTTSTSKPPPKPTLSSKPASAGHSLASNDNTPTWRCTICTFINPFTRDICTKCKEPVTEEIKIANSTSKEREFKTVGDGVFNVPAVRSIAQKSAAPVHEPTGASKAVSKANIHGVVQSKLNHDTAAYRGKFEDPNAPVVKVHTIGNSTKNGFVSSSAKPKSTENAWDAHQNKPIKQHKNFTINSKPKSTLEMLQSVETDVNQIGMLQHTGKGLAPEKKAMIGGQMSKYEM